MIALIQRVSEAAVHVDGTAVGEINKGILILLGVEREDDEAKAKRLMERVLTYRIFEDDQGKMNLNVQEVNGSVLVVSQFTLPADTKKGTRRASLKVPIPSRRSVCTIISLIDAPKKSVQREDDLALI